MNKVRIAIIGLGNIGVRHAQYLIKGEIPNGELVAVCNHSPSHLQWAKENLGETVQFFDNPDNLFTAKVADAVLIATPHYSHPELAMKAMENGMHVLIEKPAGVYTKQVRLMNEVALKHPHLIFGIMYNERTNPLYQKLRDLVDSGEIGVIKRTNWIMTTDYRPQSYYNSGKWRATWFGEGGGVLLNQAIHQLDLWQWVCGMPKRVRAFCVFGKYHHIEVEDDVTAFVEYENGASGVFIASTGETPGTNRLEIIGEKGKAVVEDDSKLYYWRLMVPERQFNCEASNGFSQPESWKCEIPVSNQKSDHPGIVANWVEAILKGSPQLAPGIEGIKALELSNAMYLSTWIDNWVNLPVDEELFFNHLRAKMENPDTQSRLETF